MVFNRPNLTKKLLNIITHVQPSKIFVIADGPRIDHPTDPKHCKATRDLISQAHWQGEVLINYADVNLGCQNRIFTGLNWVFEHVDRAIILEDDCIPDDTFFLFCQELLERYQADERIMAISGNNFQLGHSRNNDSYYFSRYPHCWGWATWKRAWQHCDVEMRHWPTVKEQNRLKDVLEDAGAIRYWKNKFQRTYDHKIDSWAFCWTLSCWLNSGLTILPNENLVSNIGFDDSGTHHQNSQSTFASLSTKAVDFPLVHPKFVLRNRYADAFTQSHMFGISARIKRRIKSLLRI